MVSNWAMSSDAISGRGDWRRREGKFDRAPVKGCTDIIGTDIDVDVDIDRYRYRCRGIDIDVDIDRYRYRCRGIDIDVEIDRYRYWVGTVNWASFQKGVRAPLTGLKVYAGQVPSRVDLCRCFGNWGSCLRVSLEPEP